MFILLLSFLVQGCVHNKNERRNLHQLDEGWLFHRGDVPDAEKVAFDDSYWRKLDLPHDWSIEGTYPNKNGLDKEIFSRKSAGGISTGHTVGGVGWYRKKFCINDAEKLHLIYFEGAYMETEIWVNGQKALYHPNGYTSFFCDITPYCNPVNEENIIAVKVSNIGKNSRWYSGSGIYRHIWLISTNRFHLDTWGIFVRTKSIEKHQALIDVSAKSINQTFVALNSILEIQIIDADKHVTVRKEIPFNIKPGEEKIVSEELEIPMPQLWSVDTPNLYSAVITLKSGNRAKDKIVTPFGIRTISFSAEKGFLLNNKLIELMGGCLHHDNGILGAVAIDRAEERKVELLKANGFNAVRCSHNPPSPAFLDACDRLGLLVIDEAFDQWQKAKSIDDYHRFFDEWHRQDISSMVLRDRNHPSVIMWSIGNEIQERADSPGVEIARNLKAIIHQYDQTRPVTTAVNTFWDNQSLTWDDSERAFQNIDVCGYNYVWWEYENDHLKFPRRIIYGSESVVQDRSLNWDLVEKYPHVIGDFVWTAMDYLGESGIGHTFITEKGKQDMLDVRGWPWFNAWCGDIDICGNKKPQTLYRDVVWRNSPIEMAVHVPMEDGKEEIISYWGWPDELPSWNWDNHGGEKMAVRVYTRYPRVRLYLNGKLVDEKSIRKKNPWKYSALFHVKYIPGELKAVGVQNGLPRDSVISKTTGPASKIRLTADRLKLKNSRNDLSYINIELADKDGNLVYNNDCKLKLSVSGVAEIAGSGNASPVDMTSFRSLTPETFRGRAMAVLRPTGGLGKATLRVETTEKTGNIKPVSITVEVE